MIFNIPGQPFGKARPRRGKFGIYNPKENALAEEKIRKAYIQAKGITPEPMVGPVWISLELIYAMPKTTPKRKKELMIAGKIRPTVKPDIDNCLKTVMDALNKLAYRDDSQIVMTHCIKRYGEQAGTIIKIGRFYDDI